MKRGNGLGWMDTPQPNLRKTPRGGRRMATIMSMKFAVPSAISDFEFICDLERGRIWENGEVILADSSSSGIYHLSFIFYRRGRVGERERDT